MRVSAALVKASLFCGLMLMGANNFADVASKSLYMVAITNYQFVPAQLTVPVGTTVMWTNADAVAHTVTAVDKSWNSGPIASGSSYRHTFNNAGTFQYYCDIHPSMKGEVVVGSGSSSKT